MKVSLGFCADTERDQDIIEWYRRQDNKSAAVRAVIRQMIEGVTLADLYQKLGEIERMLKSGTMPTADTASDGDVLDPQIEQVRKALDRLGT